MIPKRVFFYWGDSPLSWMRYMTLRSFRMLNPDWEMVVYTSPLKIADKTWSTLEEQDFFKYTGGDYREKLHDLNISIQQWEPVEDIPDMGPSHTSNLVKWDILSRLGGIYSDLDILYINPIDDLYANLKDFDIGVCFNGSFYSIGLLSSTPGCQVYRQVYKKALTNFNLQKYQCLGVKSLIPVFGLNFAALPDKFPDTTFYNIPGHLLNYMVDAVGSVINDLYHNMDITPYLDCLGLHWYGGHPGSQQQNNLLTHNNYIQHPSVFSVIARRYYDNRMHAIA